SYNPRAEALPLGAEAEEASDVGAGEANVDTVQASALLLWAHRETGDAVLRDIALRHAARHIEFCLREDGSVCQSASFDPATARARAYRETAEATAVALVARHLRPDGMLSDGCYSPRIGLATRHELVWGSYYLFEALHALAGLYDPAKIV